MNKDSKFQLCLLSDRAIDASSGEISVTVASNVSGASWLSTSLDS